MDKELMAEAERVVGQYLQPGLGAEQSVQVYTQTAANYDQYVGAFNYAGPNIGAKALADLYPDPGQRENIRILDVAAGTGLVGVELQKFGFRNLDALDPSSGMLEAARQRGVYTTCYQEYIGGKQLSIKDNTYDAVISVGGFGENHMPLSAFNEMIRLVRAGGHVVVVTREQHFQTVSAYVGKFKPLLDSLQKDGHCKLLARTNIPELFTEHDGLLIVFEVL